MINFRIQDIIKIIIPGSIVLISTVLLNANFNDLTKYTLLIKDTMAINVLLFLIVIYVIGYFIDWFGSLFEHLFYQLFDKPSLGLLNGTTKRIKMEFREDIIEYLCERLKSSSQSPFNGKNAERVFKCANVLKDYNSSLVLKDRVSEYFYYKIFSRNMASSFFVSFFIYIFFFLFNSHEWEFNNLSLFLLLLFLLSTKRWSEHSHYYSRQVFYTAYDSFRNK